MVIVKNFPMPPGSNHLYKTCAVGNRIFRAPSRKHKDYKKSVKLWALENPDIIRMMKAKVKDWKALQIERYFMFHYKTIYCKDGRIKKMDVSNRIKALDDSLLGLMGLDDSQIFRGFEEKILMPVGYPECVEIRISPMEAREREVA
jgi:hypothetical protein